MEGYKILWGIKILKLLWISIILQIRKNIYKDISPDVKMTFAFLDKTDGTVLHVQSENTPLTEYQRDARFQKLYEEAHVQVYIHMHE